MSIGQDLHITKEDDDTCKGYVRDSAFRINCEEQSISFYKSDYSWDQIIQIAKWIKEERQLIKPEEKEVPF